MLMMELMLYLIWLLLERLFVSGDMFVKSKVAGNSFSDYI
jgi:hypothetical protein